MSGSRGSILQFCAEKRSLSWQWCVGSAADLKSGPFHFKGTVQDQKCVFSLLPAVLFIRGAMIHLSIYWLNYQTIQCDQCKMKISIHIIIFKMRLFEKKPPFQTFKASDRLVVASSQEQDDEDYLLPCQEKNKSRCGNILDLDRSTDREVSHSAGCQLVALVTATSADLLQQ